MSEPQKTEFTARIKGLKATGPKDPSYADSEISFRELLGHDRRSPAASRRRSPMPLKVTVERMQERVDFSQPELGSGPDLGAPCVHCSMLRGHAEDDPRQVEESRDGDPAAAC